MSKPSPLWPLALFGSVVVFCVTLLELMRRAKTLLELDNDPLAPAAAGKAAQEAADSAAKAEAAAERALAAEASAADSGYSSRKWAETAEAAASLLSKEE